MDFNALDYVILAVLVGFLIAGYRKGFLWQLLSIVGVVAAFVVAGRYHPNLAATSLFEGLRANSETTALVTAFLAIFVGLLFVVHVVVSSIARRFLQNRNLRQLDRWFGAGLGTVKGVVLLGGLAMALEHWGVAEDTVVERDLRARADGLVAGSAILPRLTDGTLAFIALIPRESREELVRIYEEQKEILAGGAPDGEDAPAEGEAGGLPDLRTNLTEGTADVEGPDTAPATAKEGTGTAEPGTAETGSRKSGDAVRRSTEASRPRGLLDLGTLRSIHDERRRAAEGTDAAKDAARERLEAAGDDAGSSSGD